MDFTTIAIIVAIAAFAGYFIFGRKGDKQGTENGSSAAASKGPVDDTKAGA